MSFEHPEIWYFLPVLLIPVIVHLFNFRRYRRVMFSNVQFLTSVQEQQASRTHLRERLVLAARLLTLFLLITAFAKPYLRRGQASAAGQQQVVSIFVDNSFSMQTLNREGSLLDEAKRRAREVVAAYSLNDRFQLLTQDFEGKHQRLLTAEEFNNAVDTISLSAQSRTLQQIINRQQSLLALQPQAVKTSYIISDFQRNISKHPSLKVDSDISVNFVTLKAVTLPNIAVDSIILLNAVHRPGAPEKVVVRLHNYADKDAQAIPLKLLINNVQKALGSISIKANTAQTDTLSFSGLQTGWQKAEIQLQDNPVTFDNRFYFTFNVQQQLPVLLINGSSPDIYLTAAFHTDPFFKLEQVPGGSVNYAGLNRYPVVLISNVKTIAAGLAQQLKNYVNGGGTLIVFPAADADLSSYKGFLQPLQAAWPDRLITTQTKVSSLNVNSPVFKNTFESVPQNPDLPVVKKYYHLANNSGAALLSLPGNEPFFSNYTSGKGKLYLSAVPLNEEYSNLPRHALLLPLLFRITLLSNQRTELYNIIGDDEQISIPQVATTGRQLFELIKGAQRLIPDVKQLDGSTRLFVADQVKQAGIYALKLKDSLVANVAFNNNHSESDLHYLNASELTKLLPAKSRLIEAGNNSVKATVTETNKGIQLWKVSLILALIFIAAEILLIRRLKPLPKDPGRI